VYLAYFVSLASVIEDALGRGRFTSIDVGHDADVARILQIDFSHVHTKP
jgi:hypothetical protein